MAEKKIPKRTCIACRMEKPKRELIRIVRTSEGKIFLDRTGKASGRGAYVCPEGNCIEKIVKYKLLKHHFDMEVTDEIYCKIKEDFFGNEK